MSTCMQWSNTLKKKTCVHLCTNENAQLKASIAAHALCGSLLVKSPLQCPSDYETWHKDIQQHVYTDFCFRLLKTAETFPDARLHFGGSCLDRSKTSEWYSCLKSGRRSFGNCPRQSRPGTSHTRNECVQEIINVEHLKVCKCKRYQKSSNRVVEGHVRLHWTFWESQKRFKLGVFIYHWWRNPWADMTWRQRKFSHGGKRHHLLDRSKWQVLNAKMKLTAFFDSDGIVRHWIALWSDHVVDARG